MNESTILLIDVSALAHQIWHSPVASDPNPNATSQAIVSRVRALASDYPHAVICTDSARMKMRMWQ